MTGKVFPIATDKRGKGQAGDIRLQKEQEEKAMTPQEAIRVLMMSPFYYKMDLPSRMLLIHEFCAIYAGINAEDR